MQTKYYDPTNPEFLQNPYPTYAKMRAEEPIAYFEKWGTWLVTKHEDVSTLLRDRRLGRIIHHIEPDKLPNNPDHKSFNSIQLGSLLEIEPPDHTRIKVVMQDVFTPKRVRSLEAKIVALVHRLIDDLEARELRQANILTDYAETIPVTVIADLLGVPEDDRHKLVPWSKNIIGMFEPERTKESEVAACNAAQEFSDYLRVLIQQKEVDPTDDLISGLVAFRKRAPDKISEQEIINNCILLLNAGHEAVVNVIGNGMLALLQHPAELEKLRNNSELIPLAVEEMMRFDTPLQFFERYVLEDLTYKGRDYKQGDKFSLFYASANHDETVFKDPTRFDVSREHNPHVAFGLGTHYCIGAPLARLELTTALRILLERLPNLSLADNSVRYVPKNVFRYLEQLLVTY